VISNKAIQKMNAVSAAVAVALGGGASPVLAQDSGEDKANVIDEIITTATRREENVQDISIAVTALDGNALKQGGIEDISRLEHLVPGMRFGKSGDEVRIAIRGTRTNNVGSEAEQVVGIFEDGVFVPTSTQAWGSYVDVSRVEVLRGPQGTLYGRNTFGGTINVVTNQPQLDEFDGYVTGLVGSYDRTKIEGMVNVPVGDTFAFRFAAMTDVHDGYITNTWEDGTGDDLHDQDQTYVRASAKWAPSENFDATLKLTFSDKSTNGGAQWGYQQIAGIAGGNLIPGNAFAPDNASDSSVFDESPWTVRRDFASSTDNENSSTTLTLNYHLDSVSFKFVGDTTNFKGRQISDFDYSDGNSFGDPGTQSSDFAGWDSNQDTWSTEFQVMSNTDGALEWLLGAYFYEQKANWNWLEMWDGVVGEPHWDSQGDYISESTGYFGNAKFSVTDRMRLVAGLRFNEDSKQNRDPLDWSVWPPVPLPGQGAKEEWDKTLWKAGMEYDVNDSTLAYLSGSTGYRAGGTNPSGAGIPPSYGPEEVTAYEAGLKTTVLDGTMRLNLAAYMNQYRDMHMQSFVDLGGSAVAEFTQNGGEVDATGLEVEMAWYPSSEIFIGLTMAFMDAEFGTFQALQVPPLGDIPGRQDLSDPNGILDMSGWKPALSPDFSASLQLSYDFELNNGALIRPYYQTAYSSRYWGHDINWPGSSQEAHTISDLRITYISPNDRWEVQGFIQNIENEPVITRIVIFDTGNNAEVNGVSYPLASMQTDWNNPRTWGVSASYRFE
jgi:outer membrane receptor protein involved in Fe transport